MNPASIFANSKKIALTDQGVFLGYVDSNNKEISGNQIVMFESALQDTMTIIHEVTHSFNAPHPFERENFSLHQGFTDLVLDYSWFKKQAFLKVKSDEDLYMKFNIDDSNLSESLPESGVVVLDLKNEVNHVNNKANDEGSLYFGNTNFKSQLALNIMDIEDIQNDYSAR